MAIFFVLFALILFTAGCKSDTVKSKNIEKTTEKSLNIEKDSLINHLIASVRFINEIDDSLTSISLRIETPRTGERNIKNYQQELRGKLSEISQRLRIYKEEITRLSTSNYLYASQIDELKSSLSLREERITRYEKMIDDLRDELKQKKLELSKTLITLKNEVNAKQILKLKLEEEINTLKEEYELLQFTAYYVYGTEEQLESKGLVKYSGGIFLFGLGRTPVPSFFDTTSDFKKIDIRNTSEIVLDSEIKKIITPQNQDYCQVNGNRLKIIQPVKFWRGSRYLFIVTK